MTFRRLALNLAGGVKNTGFANYLLRKNPLYYESARRAFGSVQPPPASPKTSFEHLLQRSLGWAQQTDHGRPYRPALNDWPILCKGEVAASPARFERRTLFSAAAATGGTSGRPLPLWRSPENVAAEQAMIDSLVCPSGGGLLGRRVAILRADYVKNPADSAPPFGLWRNRKRWLVLSNPHLSAQTISWYHSTLEAFRPEVLWVYPSAIAGLLTLLEQHGLKLSVDTVLSSSEMLPTSLRDSIARCLSSRVIDLYGHGERMCSAYSVRPMEYWFNPAYGFVELIPSQSEWATTDRLSARIISTGYWNSAFPLIRYDTGDLALIPASSTSADLTMIAAGQLPFLGIVGRADDYLIGRAGTRITGLNHLPRELNGVIQLQVIQESPELVRIIVIPRGTLSGSDRLILERNARELLPPYMQIQILVAQKLQTLPNGKAPFIIRR